MALADANIEFKDVQAMFLEQRDDLPGNRPKTAFMFGRTTIPIVNIEAACSGGGACLRMAQMAIGQGEYDVVLAVGVEKRPWGFLAPVISGYEPWQALAGLDENPMYWAMDARLHMETYGTTIEIAQVSLGEESQERRMESQRNVPEGNAPGRSSEKNPRSSATR